MANKRPRHVVDERAVLTAACSAVPLGALRSDDTTDAAPRGDTTHVNPIHRRRLAPAVSGVVTVAPCESVADVPPSHFVIPAAVQQRMAAQSTTNVTLPDSTLNDNDDDVAEDGEAFVRACSARQRHAPTASSVKPLIANRSWRRSLLQHSLVASNDTAASHEVGCDKPAVTSRGEIGDDVIRFDAAVSDTTTSSSSSHDRETDSDVPRRRRARHMDHFDSAFLAREEALLRSQSSSPADSEAESVCVNAMEEQLENEPEESGTTSQDGLSAARHSRTTPFQRFGSLYFACHTSALTDPNGTACHHTLLGLRRPLTIQGPCGLVGLGMGEVSIGGFMLGRKQVSVWSEEQRVVVRPVTPFRTRAAQVTRLPRPPRLHRMPHAENILGRVLQPTTAEDEAEDEVAMMYDAEAVFGTVDWGWVQHTLEEWRRVLGRTALSAMSVVLVLQSPSASSSGSCMRRHLLPRTDTDAAAQPFCLIPAFIARHAVNDVDPELLSKVIPTIATQGRGTCVVVGSRNVGKSTLCRYLANALLSQHGCCFWFDVDLGQPEFDVPGQIGLYRLQYPILRPHDALGVRRVRGAFVGATTIRCPQTVARAVAWLCEVVTHVAASAPVVVNTHGWVLQTGRRVTVEVLRRLRPQHAIQLLRPHEEPWLRDTDAIQNPSLGLNAQVVARRFLVRWRGASAQNTTSPSTTCLVSLPAASPSLCHKSTPWQGQVHLVRVERDEDTLKATPGSAGRRECWRRHLAPLLHHYTSLTSGGTTLLRGSLAQLHRIVLAERDEVNDLRGSDASGEVAALLEHAVVAMEFRRPDAVDGLSRVCGLASLPTGFEVSCYGYVESGEAELRAGRIAVRVPLAPCVVAAMMRSCPDVLVSIAYAAAMREDTAFMEQYP